MTDYISEADFKLRHKVPADKASFAEDCCTRASRKVDGITRRTFAPHSGTATARYFRPATCGIVFVDDCYDISAVEYDADDDGTYETTISSADYLTLPLNGVGRTGLTGWPTEQIHIVSNSYYFPTCNLRPAVKVTAKWGWATVPEDVVEATHQVAHRLYYENDVPSGIAPGSVEFGGVGLRRQYTVDELLEPFTRGDRKIGIA